MAEYKAYLETTMNGKPVRLPVYNKRQACFKTRDQAVRALMRKGLPGRGLVVPLGMTVENGDWSQIYTIAL